MLPVVGIEALGRLMLELVAVGMVVPELLSLGMVVVEVVAAREGEEVRAAPRLVPQ